MKGIWIPLTYGFEFDSKVDVYEKKIIENGPYLSIRPYPKNFVSHLLSKAVFWETKIILVIIHVIHFEFNL